MDTARPIDAFAWQYAFYAHLVYKRAAAPEAQLSDLAQVMCALSQHQEPKSVVEAVLLSWPFNASQD
jgi:hypothetical protein